MDYKKAWVVISGDSKAFAVAYKTYSLSAIYVLMEKEMAIHSSTLAWKIPWTEEPGRLQSMGLQRVRQD